MANVKLQDLTKFYKRGSEVIRALDGVTINIDKGEFVAVVGRSGSGKTTMLDLLGLLLKPTAGSLFIDDVDTAKLGDRERARMRAGKEPMDAVDQIGWLRNGLQLVPEPVLLAEPAAGFYCGPCSFSALPACRLSTD